MPWKLIEAILSISPSIAIFASIVIAGSWVIQELYNKQQQLHQEIRSAQSKMIEFQQDMMDRNYKQSADLDKSIVALTASVETMIEMLRHD